MSQNAGKSSLEALEIKPYLITKLKSAGIESIFDLAIAVTHQLLEGADERVSLELVIYAMCRLPHNRYIHRNIINYSDKFGK